MIYEFRSNTLARFLDLPAKKPLFSVEFCPLHVYVGYVSGLEYNIDGWTFEKEWKIYDFRKSKKNI